MKLIPTFLTILLGLAITVPEAEARGDSRGGGRSSSSRSSTPKRSSSTAKRSPMTGSKVQRPAARPAPKPASRPQTKPAARPEVKPAARPQAKPATRPQTKPAERPSVQKPSVQKPTTRPATLPDRKPDSKPDLNRPDNRPGGNNKPDLNRPDNRPGGNNRPDLNRPDNRPGGNNKPDLNRPDNRPNTLPGTTRPDNRPSLERPDKNKPSTLPGMVSYPNRPDKGKPDRPNIGGNDRDKVNIGDRNNKINTGDRNNKVNIDNSRNRNNVHIDNVNVGRRNVGLNNPGNRPANKRNWDNNKWGGKKSVWGNNVNIGNDVNVNIDNNFRHSNNFAYRPNAWGARPWWGASNCHGWHHGHWNYGYNSHYYHSHWYHDDDDFARGFMWGIGVWSLGNMIYNMGYQTYRNPYPAPPVQYQGSNSQITYTEPVSVTAAANPPGDDQTADIAETKSDEALERSRDAFKQGDYLAASKSVDEAIGYTPGDVSLHEYRALVFFTLGKYSDAAGVLNPVLASGPGWSWDTMIGFYNGSEAYNEQLRKLEAYVKAAPDKADARFLLGYHYMVCGHMEKSYEQFAKATELQPADSISRQLRDLTKSSIPDGGDSEAEPPAKPAPVPADQLVGTWVCDRGADGKVTFTMTEAGDYTWTFMSGGQSNELKGSYGLNDKGLLVLTSDDSQMVSAIEMTEGSKLHFTLIGAPDGDPGLDFTKG